MKKFLSKVGSLLAQLGNFVFPDSEPDLNSYKDAWYELAEALRLGLDGDTFVAIPYPTCNERPPVSVVVDLDHARFKIGR